MAHTILTINAGSSSLKFALFAGNGERLHKGAFEIGALSHDDAMRELLAQITSLGLPEFTAAGHRVVHGGQHFTAPVLVNDDILTALEKLTPLAPLHQPHNLHPITALKKLMPNLPQVACFDTAFHATQSATTRRYALPRALEAEGVKRYGFHGLSYEYIAQKLAQLDPAAADRRVIVAHLGNGASLCALRHGKSIDTTLGFSALDGLVMGTRCGALDPEIVLYLQREKGMSIETIEDLLYRRSGLLGVSGISSDMRELQASEETSAKEAVELFVFRAVREMGALIASLGGLDDLVFTAGIGEHSAAIRSQISKGIGWLGSSIDEAANLRATTVINTEESAVNLWMIPTDEEAMIARHTAAVIA